MHMGSQGHGDIKKEILEGIYLASEKCHVKDSRMRTTTPSVHLKEKRGILSRSKALMPDLMENSSNESDKRQTNTVMEHDNLASSSAGNTSSLSSEIPFPSLSDSVLKKLSLFGDQNINENLGDQDIEDKFSRLSVAFKADKFTLSRRLELQQRQRETAEKNIESELNSLRESLNVINHLCTDSQMREVIAKTQQDVDIVQQAITRMSTRAETCGAIQQEKRMNLAFETIMAYVEHLRHTRNKEQQELEDYRRLLMDNNLIPDDKSGESSEESKRFLPLRSLSVSGSSKPGSRRRASVAAFNRPYNIENYKGIVSSPSSMSSMNSGNGVEPRTRLLSAICLLTNHNTTVGTSSSVSSPSISIKSRRSSLPVGPVVGLIRPSQLVTSFPPQTPQTVSNRSHGDISEHPEQLTDIQNKDPSNVLYREDSLADKDKTDSNSKMKRKSDPSFHSPNSNTVEMETGEEPVMDSNISHPKEDISTQVESMSKPNLWQSESIFEQRSCFFYENIGVAAAILSCTRYFNVWHQWTLEQDIWHWDNTSVFKRLRYFFSILLLLGALLSLLVTFLPSTAAASICNGYSTYMQGSFGLTATHNILLRH